MRILSVFLLFLTLLSTVLLFLDESFFLNLFDEVEKSPRKPESLNHPLMKPKVIWLNTDAYSTYLTGDLSTFSNYSSFYHIRNLGYPQSAAIASTQFLGRTSRNYVGNLLVEDTIVDQLSTNKFSIVTTNFPVLSILGPSRFLTVKQGKGRENYPMSRVNYNNILPFPITNVETALNTREATSIITRLSEEIMEKTSISRVTLLLNIWTEYKKLNFMYYTAIMDSYNHNYAGLHSNTLAGAALLLADIKLIIKAIEQSDYRDEYMLIVSSDHGGQLYFGEDEICNHGCQMDKGNEGFLYIYSYGTDWAEDWIYNEDVAAIIAGYAKDAAIPIKAKGWPRKIKNNGTVYLDELYWNSLKIKEFQLMTALGLDEAESMPIEDFILYLKKLDKELQRKEAFYGLVLIIVALASFVLWKMWKVCGFDGIWLVFEHAFVAVFAKDGRRIENILYWPVLVINLVSLGMLVWEVFKWKKKESGFFKKFKRNLRKLTKSNPSLFVCIGNLWFLATRAEKVNPEQIYTFYYLHYFLIVSSLLYFFSKIESKLKYFLSLVSTLILGLMLFYEFITDYTMTDQTEGMILASRAIYLSILSFSVFLMLLPKNCNKLQLFGVIIVLLYYFVASQQQRNYFCCFYLPASYLLMTHNQVKELLLLGISAYIAMLGTFGFDISLRAGNHSWGVNPDDFPIFTGFIFGIHKFSWLIISGTAIMGCSSFNHYFTPLILRAYLAILLFLYLFFTEPASVLSGFMWCMGQNLSLLLSHTLGLIPEFTYTSQIKP